jgi:hypothetical protein
MQKTELLGLGQVGYISDLQPIELPPNAWSYVQNMRCKDGAIESFSGYQSFNTITPLPDTIEVIKTADVSGFMYAAGTKIYSLFSGTETDISNGAYSGTNEWYSCVQGGIGIFTNGADNPQYWGGSGACVDLPYDTSCSWADVGMTAQMIVSFKNFLFALDVKDCSGRNRRRIVWSHPADPGSVPVTWDIADADHLASDAELDKTPGAIIDAKQMRDTLQIYKEDAIYAVTYTGDTYIFNIRLVTSKYGLYSRDCVCDIGGTHVFIGNSDIWHYDGVNFISIATHKVRDLFFDNVSRGNKDKAFVTFNQNKREVWVCYPSANSSTCDKALIWNIQDQTWSQRNIPNVRCATYGHATRSSGYTWATLPYATWDDWGITPSTPAWTTWDTPIDSNPLYDSLFLCSSGYIYEMDYGTSENGSALECIARRTDLDFGDTIDFHTVMRIYLKASGDAFTVRVGYQDEATASVTWSSYQTFTPGTDYKLDFRVTGRLHAIELYSSSTSLSWKVYSIGIDFQYSGRR